MEFCPGPISVRVVVVLIGGSVIRTVVVVVTIDGEVPLVLSAEVVPEWADIRRVKAAGRSALN